MEFQMARDQPGQVSSGESLKILKTGGRLREFASYLWDVAPPEK